ncbi:telomere-associated putative RecQ-like protein usher [Leptodontidium sp. MPI-SDFR-AT-0119]|nr:telomere-associated putative RecQ-like protein usher [Leptodontidium sp. MPI-SDFR-AT-0119]
MSQISDLRVLVLFYIPPGPPLREPELLSSGAYKDNIRFLPKAIRDLVLLYIIYVLLLRQLFLRQTLSAYLRKAYTRAKFVASITKEKFSTKEQANFDLEESTREDIKDELNLVTLAELGNHTFYTFNYRTFFRFDHVLQGKRPRSASETLSLRMLNASKRGQLRRKGAYSKADLLAVARRLYNKPDLQFRVPGQPNGVLAIMGP